MADVTSPTEMAKFADDVRNQQGPFIEAASQTFADMLPSEYRRLRAAALESGGHEATLTVTLRFNFDPAARSIEVLTAPNAATPKPKRKAVALPCDA